MPVEIAMPKLGLTMKEGRILEWKKKEGDRVKRGEVLFVLETEKVTFEVESPEDGILAKILVQAQEVTPVGAVVGYLLRPGENGVASDLRKDAGTELTATSAGISTPEPRLAQPPAPGKTRVKASPLAKKIARAQGIDLGTIRGSGDHGRILKKDIEEAPPSRASERIATSDRVMEGITAPKLEALTGMRKAIAKKMLAAKLETAQTYMAISVDASRIVEFRKILLPYVEEKAGVRLTLTDILLKITGAAVQEHPIMNTRWTEGGIVYESDVHMGMAMALDTGLIVPVIRDINKKGICQIAEDRAELVKLGREKRFLPDQITGSTFTLSSMGMFGIESFTANINLPESAILAVGAILDKPVAQNGEVVIRPIMNTTLSYDHRIIDGADAGKFMRTLKSFMENPILILA
jgi:pyruvate dehydrogenase E2 component (dihydrolipoamide acetyltransferase)